MAKSTAQTAPRVEDLSAADAAKLAAAKAYAATLEDMTSPFGESKVKRGVVAAGLVGVGVVLAHYM